jgi:azurin
MSAFSRLACAAALAACLTPAWAATCEAEIESNDAMQFNKSSMNVPQSCKEFTLKLKHVGKLPRAVMGHNWVLTRTADMQGAASDGMAAGADQQFVKPNDARVIAFTKVVGGGESASVTFPASKLKAGENYTYFCSFPGHSAIMKGSLKLTK